MAWTDRLSSFTSVCHSWPRRRHFRVKKHKSERRNVLCLQVPELAPENACSPLSLCLTWIGVTAKCKHQHPQVIQGCPYQKSY